MYTTIMNEKHRSRSSFKNSRALFFAIRYSLREISSAVYLHARAQGHHALQIRCLVLNCESN